MATWATYVEATCGTDAHPAGEFAKFVLQIKALGWNAAALQAQAAYQGSLQDETFKLKKLDQQSLAAALASLDGGAVPVAPPQKPRVDRNPVNQEPGSRDNALVKRKLEDEGLDSDGKHALACLQVCAAAMKQGRNTFAVAFLPAHSHDLHCRGGSQPRAHARARNGNHGVESLVPT